MFLIISVITPLILTCLLSEDIVNLLRREPILNFINDFLLRCFLGLLHRIVARWWLWDFHILWIDLYLNASLSHGYVLSDEQNRTLVGAIKHRQSINIFSKDFTFRLFANVCIAISIDASMKVL